MEEMWRPDPSAAQPTEATPPPPGPIPFCSEHPWITNSKCAGLSHKTLTCSRHWSYSFLGGASWVWAAGAGGTPLPDAAAPPSVAPPFFANFAARSRLSRSMSSRTFCLLKTRTRTLVSVDSHPDRPPARVVDVKSLNARLGSRKLCQEYLRTPIGASSPSRAVDVC